jgi:type I restriction enzyme S subunit
MPSEALMFLPKPKKFVVDYPENVAIKKNWLLITRSGSVGRTLISTELLTEQVLSDDLIRIIPKGDNNIGYLYAYFNTWIGQAFLIKDQYGATVKHIEPHHVSGIPVPYIPDIMGKVNEKILEAHKLREEAQISLIKAEEMIYSALGLPKFNDDDVEYYGGEEGRLIKSFELDAKELSLRLDASYHTPILQIINKNLSQAKFKVSNLGSLIDDIFIPTRFKRPYVNNPNEGIPFLQGSHIPQIKPLDVKYLWKKTKKIEKKLLKRDWVLMTRSGTVGRVGIVRDEWSGWAASEHVSRIVIKQDVHPGFVYAFLLNPYGEFKVKGKIYGAVVDEIGEQDTTAP